MRRRLTHCLRGHELTEANTYHPPKAPQKNLCRECIRIRGAARGPHLPKPCPDCGAAIPHTGRKPPVRCEPCRSERHREKNTEAMRRLRASGYRPVKGEVVWTDERRARFWARVAQGDGCWEWQGLRDGNGYGLFGVANRNHGAHRASWEIANGPIPDGLMVRHDCDNPPCVRPDHLRLGTALDNARDAMERRRYQYGDRHWTRRRKAAA